MPTPTSLRLAGVDLAIGVTGFEPATFSTRTRRATKLRYTPDVPTISAGPSIGHSSGVRAARLRSLKRRASRVDVVVAG